MPRLHRFLPFLQWPRPDGALLRNEALAGLTVGLMVVPQGVAYAALAGMPLVTGIYAALLPALIAVLFSASPRLSVGPTALTCLLVGSSLAPLATPGSAEWVQLAVWLALLSGVLQVLLGLVRYGWLLNLVNSPVLMAFTQAAAVLIIASQLPALTGFDNMDALLAGRGWHLQAFAFGLGALALLVGARRLRPGFPSVLVLVLVSAGLSRLLGFEAQGGPVIGTLPQGLPALFLPGWPGWETLGALVLPTLMITLVSFLETASSAKVDSGQRGSRWDQDQDLIGQGLAKLASGLTGAMPTSSSFSRSALNLYAGAQTAWATVFSVAVVLLALLLAMPLLHHVPLAVLAAIVVLPVWGLIKPRAFVHLWRLSRVEALIAGATFAITLLAAPRLYWGVLAGVVMALTLFLYLRLHPRIIEVGLHPDGSLRDRHLWQLPPLAPRLYALRMDAALDFATASALERAVADHLQQQPDTTHVMLVAHPINWIDATGAEAFGRLREQLDDRRVHLHLVGVKLPVERVLRTAGHLHENERLHLYRTEAEALQAIAQGATAEPQAAPRD
ncbi:MAG: SulP family inorganic anion transporter [Comamonadaceae bacterium]|jgi:SulP family sulfate permease|uniref:SulP family inorganic anion transporter n=1 Tax=Hydrogenophaga borbori TaxID=2294117 RepID=A0A372EGB0_9BURK|nr:MULTISPECIES: SulP family inorganic anion transporter [Hydrogenophaga]NCT97545.1 SulP family inorganic anion transporter [Comamonadaceae bacterium]RFP77466.1 SulP family inorganic anion transporter [Hydrogenophaga borbori]WQB83240.1 SulP family inorganic anion transporter [Hydrogenophaga sp. SNF1]